MDAIAQMYFDYAVKKSKEEVATIKDPALLEMYARVFAFKNGMIIITTEKVENQYNLSIKFAKGFIEPMVDELSIFNPK